MAGNRATRQRLGAATAEQFLGKTDADFIPGQLVRDFREDDARVIRTGKPIVNRLESWLDEQRQLRWFLTTKLPLYGKHGRPVGVMAVIRRHEEERPSEQANETTRAVAFVKANPSACPANTIIVYAWNEHDEGGWLCPTWTPSGSPDTSRLDAIRSILR